MKRRIGKRVFGLLLAVTIMMSVLIIPLMAIDRGTSIAEVAKICKAKNYLFEYAHTITYENESYKYYELTAVAGTPPYYLYFFNDYLVTDKSLLKDLIYMTIANYPFEVYSIFASSLDLDYYSEKTDRLIKNVKKLNWNKFLEDSASFASEALGHIAAAYFTGGDSATAISSIIKLQTNESLVDLLNIVRKLIVIQQYVIINTEIDLIAMHRTGIDAMRADDWTVTSLEEAKYHVNRIESYRASANAAEMLVLEIAKSNGCEEANFWSQFTTVMGGFLVDFASGLIGDTLKGFIESPNDLKNSNKLDDFSVLLKNAKKFNDGVFTFKDLSDFYSGCSEFGTFTENLMQIIDTYDAELEEGSILNRIYDRSILILNQFDIDLDEEENEIVNGIATYNFSSEYMQGKYYTQLIGINLTGNSRQDIVAVARSQVGYHEGNNRNQIDGNNSTGSENYTEYGYWYDGKYDGFINKSWCAMFVSWCARRAKIPTSIISNATYAKAANEGSCFKNLTFYNRGSYTPVSGDLIFFDWQDNDKRWDHIGIVSSVSSTHVTFIDGNSSSNSVLERSFSLNNSYIKGYGVPAYQDSHEEQNVTFTNITIPTTTNEWRMMYLNRESTHVHDRGTSFSLKGTITSDNLNIVSVTCQVVNERTGAIPQQKTVQCNTKSFSISSQIDSYIKFAQIPVGHYRLKYTATLSDGTNQTYISDLFAVMEFFDYTRPNFTVKVDENNNLIATWTASGDYVTHYHIHLYSENGVINNPAPVLKTVSGDTLSYNLGPFSPGTYELFVIPSTKDDDYGLYAHYYDYGDRIIYKVKVVNSQSSEKYNYAYSSGYRSSSYYSALKNVVLTGDERKDIVAIARSQIGYHEGNSIDQLNGYNSSGTGNYTEYGYWYDGPNSHFMYQAWCAMFVSWCARHANISTEVISNATFAKAANEGACFKNLLFKTKSEYTPIAGDLVFFNWHDNDKIWDHVGIVSAVRDGRIYFIDGNSSAEAVREHSYPLDSTYIHGYGIPAYKNVHEHSPGVAATCTSDQTCTVCGTILNEKLGHDYDAEVMAPTCTEKGYTAHTCHCGDTYVDSYVNALGHTFGEWVETKAPTCTTAGSEKRECSNCDHFETREVAVTGHSHKATVTAPTCTEKGYTSHVCHCGDSYVDTYVNALGHNFGEWYEAKAPTESAQGEKRRYCKNCDEYEIMSIPVLTHSHDRWDAITLNAVAPTCTAIGLTEGKKCSGCDEILVAQKVIPATGHSFGEWSEAKAPTCTLNGVEKRSCKICDHTEIRDVVATGHSYKATVTAPTCTEKGYTSHVCHCGDSYVDTYVNALGHNFGEWYETKAPTEAAQGEKRRDCKICDAYETTPVAPLSHSHDSWDVITLEAVAPTCTANGLTDGKKCAGCGEILVNQEVIPAVGHNSSDWIVDVEPTPGVAGSKHKECVTCGELLETAIIEVLPEVIDPETEPETTPETEPETEPDTEVETEPETEPVTESETVHETESGIEAETPVITEPISESTIDSVLEGETTATLPSDAGCSGTVQISLLLLLTIILPMAVMIRKKD